MVLKVCLRIYNHLYYCYKFYDIHTYKHTHGHAAHALTLTHKHGSYHTITHFHVLLHTLLCKQSFARTHLHAHICTHTFACTHLHAHTRLQARTYIHAFGCTHIYLLLFSVLFRTDMHIFVFNVEGHLWGKSSRR